MPSSRILEPSRATFRYVGITITPAATPTEIVTLKGAAGKIIQVRRVFMSGFATTAGMMGFFFIKRTAPNTGGTFTTPTGAQADNDGVAAGAINQYSVNPTALGAGSNLAFRRLLLNLSTAVPDRVEVFFGKDVVGGKSVRLNNASEWFAIQADGNAVPATGRLDIEIDWTEQ